MKKTKQYRSPLMASIHETAEDLHGADLMNKLTMRKFDAMCLRPVPRLMPKQIRDLRLREGASQAVFARYLNVTTGLISQWERGEKHPQGTSLKLLAFGRQKWARSCCMNAEAKRVTRHHIDDRHAPESVDFST